MKAKALTCLSDEDLAAKQLLSCKFILLAETEILQGFIISINLP